MAEADAQNLRIGAVMISGRAALAPMSGVTDLSMRRIARRYGAGLVVSEMVASDQLALRDAEACLRAEGVGIAPHVVQIAGCEAYWMGEGARAAEAAGADIIDINMGCPAKRVTNGWSGSALMRDLDAACRLIEATVKATSRPVTLKTRLGWDDNSHNAAELARRAQDLGVMLVTIHGRTRQQFYKGQANWRAVRPVREAMALPLIVNGDIDGPATARRAVEAAGADMAMIGRAAMGRPWLVGQVSAALTGRSWTPPSPRDKADTALEHYDGLLSAMGRDKGLRHARKHVAAYIEEARRQAGRISPGEAARLLTSECTQTVRTGLVEAFLSSTPETSERMSA